LVEWPRLILLAMPACSCVSFLTLRNMHSRRTRSRHVDSRWRRALRNTLLTGLRSTCLCYGVLQHRTRTRARPHRAEGFRFLRGAAVIIFGGGLPGCIDQTPVRIVFARDTLTINTRFPNAPGARAVNRAGDTLAERVLRYSAAPAAMVRVSESGRVSCLESGYGTLAVSAGAARAQTPVHCWLVHRIAMPMSISLQVGASPRRIEAEAFDDSSHVIPHAHLGITVNDTTIVALRDGMLAGIRVGRTMVSATAGDRYPTGSMVNVYQRVLWGEPVQLAVGQSKSWALAPGEYQLDMLFSSPPAGDAVIVSWPGTYCGDLPPGLERHVRCLVRGEAGSARLVVRHARVGAGLAASLNGSLSLTRSAAQ
jgi:hypothetical protein